MNAQNARKNPIKKGDATTRIKISIGSIYGGESHMFSNLLLDVDLCRPEIHSSSFFKSSGCFVKSFSKSSFASSAEKVVLRLFFTAVAHNMHTKKLEWS